MRLIDADALLEEGIRFSYAYNDDGIVLIPMGEVRKSIKNAPTIEAEPVRHGEWIGLEYDGFADGCPVYDLWECSECHIEHEGEEDTLTDYCPHCGAKMDLE